MKTSHPESLMTAELKVSTKPIAGHPAVINNIHNATKSDRRLRNKGLKRSSQGCKVHR